MNTKTVFYFESDMLLSFDAIFCKTSFVYSTTRIDEIRTQRLALYQ